MQYLTITLELWEIKSNMLSIRSVHQTVIHLPLFLTFKSIIHFLWHIASPDWHFWWAAGAFTEVRQTLSDNSALVGMSNLKHQWKDNTTQRMKALKYSLFIFDLMRSTLCFMWYFMHTTLSLVLGMLVCIYLCALWTAPSHSYHPHQLLVSFSSPKSSWPSSNKPISCNQALSCPFSYIHPDIHRLTHTHHCQLFMQVFYCPSWTCKAEAVSAIVLSGISDHIGHPTIIQYNHFKRNIYLSCTFCKSCYCRYNTLENMMIQTRGLFHV